MKTVRFCPACGATLERVSGTIGEPTTQSAGITSQGRQHADRVVTLRTHIARPAVFWACPACEFCAETLPDHDECPEEFGDPDHCARCEGWGHRCPVWRACHTAEQIARVEGDSHGWDPRRFYTEKQ